MKECIACGKVKPLALFHRRRDRADGRRDECKECMRRRSKGYWHNNGIAPRHYVQNKEEAVENPTAWTETAPTEELLREFRYATELADAACAELQRRGWGPELAYYR